jgi:sugar phosphate isomerase/epimerase
MPDPDLARFALNQATIPGWTLAQAIEACARSGLGGIGVWRDPLAEMGIEAAARAIRDAGLFVPTLCKSGPLGIEEPAARRAAMDDNRKALDEAAAIGAACLVMIVGGVGPDKDLEATRARVEDGLAELLPHARARGLTLGLEPLHPMYCADRSCLNSIAQANDLCDSLGEGTSLVADVYHSWWDPGFRSELERAGPARIATFHLSDWLVPTRHLLLDRGMVGDGVIDIATIRGWLDAIAYDGPFEHRESSPTGTGGARARRPCSGSPSTLQALRRPQAAGDRCA